jgi:hypothetical protein
MQRSPYKFKRLHLLLSSFWVLALVACAVVISTSRKASLEIRTPHEEQASSLKAIPQLIKNTKTAGARFRTQQLFESSTSRVADDAGLRKALNDGTTLNLNRENIQRILSEDVQFLVLPLPDGRGGNLELELVKVNIFAPGFTVNVASTGKEVEGNLGAHYRGIVRGNDNSLAAVSVFDNEVMGFYSTGDEGNNVIGRIQGDNPTDRHVIYNDNDLKGRPDFSCETDDLVSPLPGSAPSAAPPPTGDTVAANCVKMYVEADYNIYTNRGSIANARNFLTGVFNQSATIYANDTIPVAMSQLLIWDVPSGYTSSSSTTMLDGFHNRRLDYKGDNAHLVSFFGGHGGLAYVNVLCNRAFAHAYSGLNPSFQNVPTYSWSVMVFTHEAGHNLASPHTHSCSWNGNNTAIDSCSAPTGGCASPGIPPEGGTIMSYCHLQSVGINFTLGFGPQPKALILQRIAAAVCLTDCALAPFTKRPFDFDGDGKADLSVFRASDGAWHILRSGSSYTGISFGSPTDVIAPADYDGDGRTDLAVFRPSTGVWYLQRSTTGFKGVGFGTSGDMPLPGDFDGDGLADISLFRPSDGGWYRINSGNGQFSSLAFGQNGDVPVQGDFDGDGKADPAVFRPSTSSWYMQRSAAGFTGVAFGAAGDKPVTGDFDGDGLTDIGVFRPSTGAWYLLGSNMGVASYSFGATNDIPVPADYDGDGRTDIGVFRPSTGSWYLLRSTSGFLGQSFGNGTDKPVPSAYVP